MDGPGFSHPIHTTLFNELLSVINIHPSIFIISIDILSISVKGQEVLSITYEIDPRICRHCVLIVGEWLDVECGEIPFFHCRFPRVGNGSRSFISFGHYYAPRVSIGTASSGMQIELLIDDRSF